jgi:hypothetical protein
VGEAGPAPGELGDIAGIRQAPKALAQDAQFAEWTKAAWQRIEKHLTKPACNSTRGDDLGTCIHDDQNLPSHPDCDPACFWMTVEASSAFHAAIYYCGACAARGGGPPVPTPATIITVRVDGKEYRVREGRMREWANVIAERDAERRKAAEKKSRGA